MLRGSIEHIQKIICGIAAYDAWKAALLRKLNELFPWMQPNALIEDPFRRKEAVHLLKRIMELEKEALNALLQLHQRIE
jgi:hypothetical protein